MAGKKPVRHASALTYTGLGFEVSGLLIGSAVIGYYLDKWLGTSPILIIIMVIVGTVAMLIRVVQLLKWMERRD
jgi:F0F1-type ATP synthase assembly protein I